MVAKLRSLSEDYKQIGDLDMAQLLNLERQRIEKHVEFCRNIKA